jgi:hypothetical protein
MANKSKTSKVKTAQKQGQVKSKMEISRAFQATPVMRMTRGPTDIVRLQNQEATALSIKGSSTTPYTGRTFIRLTAGGTGANLYTWLPTVARQYSMYRFRSVKFRFIPSVGTTQSGIVAMGFFPDCEEASVFFNTSGTGTLGQLSQCRKYSQGPVYSDLEISLTPADFALDWYYIDPSPSTVSETRLTTAGALAMYVVSNASLLDSEVGTLYIEYDVELKFPVTTNPDLQ